MRTDRVLISLSRGGADAVVAREFDLERKAFVRAAEGGFELPEGKSDFCYKARGTSEHGGEQCALTGGGVRATRTATRCWWAASSARPR